MAADIKGKYGSTKQALTITLTSLASSATAGRESTVVDNSSNLYLDALLGGKIKIQNTTPANDKAIYVYGYGTVNTTDPIYTGNVTGSDANYTMDDPTTLRLIGVIPVPTANITYYFGPWRVADAFGGVLPEKWGVVVRNFSGATLSATGSDSAIWYQGVYGQTT